MGYGARARVQVGIRTMVEPVWNQTPSLAPVSLPFAVLGPLPCAHLAQNPPSLRRPTGLFTPDSKHRGIPQGQTGAQGFRADRPQTRAPPGGDLLGLYSARTTALTVGPSFRVP